MSALLWYGDLDDETKGAAPERRSYSRDNAPVEWRTAVVTMTLYETLCPNEAQPDLTPPMANTAQATQPRPNTRGRCSLTCRGCRCHGHTAVGGRGGSGQTLPGTGIAGTVLHVGGGGDPGPQFVYLKWPDQIFPVVNFIFSHDGHFGRGRGGGQGGGGAPLLEKIKHRPARKPVISCSASQPLGNFRSLPPRQSGTPTVI